MAYLTFEEYRELTGAGTNDSAAFAKNYNKAAAVIDNVTNHFYQRCPIESDKVAYRVRQFKLALASQIEYFIEMGSNTFESINNVPQTFSAGRTSISNASRYNPSGANESKSLVAEDVYIYLEGTGLLYRGVIGC